MGPRPPRPPRCVAVAPPHRPSSAPPAFRTSKWAVPQASAPEEEGAACGPVLETDVARRCAPLNIGDPLCDAAIGSQNAAFDAEVERMSATSASQADRNQRTQQLDLPPRPSSARSADRKAAVVTPKRLAALQREVKLMKTSGTGGHNSAGSPQPTTEVGDGRGRIVKERKRRKKKAKDSGLSATMPSPVGHVHEETRYSADPLCFSPPEGVAKIRHIVQCARVEAPDVETEEEITPATVMGDNADCPNSLHKQVRELSTSLTATHRQHAETAPHMQHVRRSAPRPIPLPQSAFAAFIFVVIRTIAAAPAQAERGDPHRIGGGSTAKAPSPRYRETTSRRNHHWTADLDG